MLTTEELSLHWEKLENPVISVFDRENSRLYLLNTQGEIYSQFPVFSLSQADCNSGQRKTSISLSQGKELCSGVSEQ